MAKPLQQRIASTRELPNGIRIDLVYRIGDADPVPAILLLPAVSEPAPGALLLHGYTSHKEQMATSVGRALLSQGVASLSIDMPLHGERSGRMDARLMRNPLELVRRWREALSDCSAGLRYLAARKEVDAERIGLVGYSMGSFLGVLTAAKEPIVKAVVLAAGGDLPDGTPFEAVVRRVADPLRAVKTLDGRPLLMVNGKRDRTIKPLQAQRLYDAALQPKEIRWVDSGHWLPDAAIASGAEWLQHRLGSCGGAEHDDK